MEEFLPPLGFPLNRKFDSTLKFSSYDKTFPFSGNNSTDKFSSDSLRLELMSEEDVSLRLKMETDPTLMVELGGPRPRQEILNAHAKSLIWMSHCKCWPLKILLAGITSPVGTVVVFPSFNKDIPIYEIGWIVLSEYQNRGFASLAVGMVLEEACLLKTIALFHAFPAVTNIASNRVCEKNGFTKLSKYVIEYNGRTLHCNHWQKNLS